MPTERHRVAAEAEFDGEDARVIVERGDLEIAVFRLDGDYHAVANYCPHQAGPLCEGQRTGRVTLAEDGWSLDYSDERYIECPWHSWQFDIETGVNAADPRYRVPTYDVEVDDGVVYVLR